jgi:hypothetical protein
MLDFQSMTFQRNVQRDVTGVETRLERSVPINYLVAKVFFLNLKGHYCERNKKPD